MRWGLRRRDREFLGAEGLEVSDHEHGPASSAGDPTPGRMVSPLDAERQSRADALYHEARAIRQRDHERLRSLAEQSLELSRHPDSNGESYEAGQARALSMLAYFNAASGQCDAAISQAAEALGLLASHAASTVLGDIYEAMGWAHSCRGEFVDAIDALLRTQMVARETGDPGLLAMALGKMASVHRTTGHLRDAVDGHTQAMNIQRGLGDELNVALAQDSLARDYVATAEYDKALATVREALSYVKHNDAPDVATTVYTTAAIVFVATGDLDKAHDYATRGLELSRQRESIGEQCENLITLSRVGLRRRNYDAALTAAERALAVAQTHGRPIEEFRCQELLSEIQERRGDFAAALASYRRFHELEHARINEESETRIAHLRVEHQLESANKDAEIHRLRSLTLEREVEERRLAHTRLEAQASLDPLTGLYNRRHLAVIADELQAAMSRGDSVCLALFDVDRFKRVNDTYGHMTGDRVLVAVALLLGRNSRASDVPCRYGGDEFLVLLVGMDAEAAREAAERLRATVADATIEHDSAHLSITISVGVVCAPADGRTDLPTLIERADRALYSAKQTGRNRVVLA